MTTHVTGSPLLVDGKLREQVPSTDVLISSLTLLKAGGSYDFFLFSERFSTGFFIVLLLG
jgi:hypothetical protein